MCGYESVYVYVAGFLKIKLNKKLQRTDPKHKGIEKLKVKLSKKIYHEN